MYHVPVSLLTVDWTMVDIWQSRTNQISFLRVLKSERFRELGSVEGFFFLSTEKQRKPVEGRMKEGENDKERERDRPMEGETELGKEGSNRERNRDE